MNKAKRALRAADEFQQRHAWLAFPIAVWKKFGDDQAGNLAMLVAWFAFVSIFPLMLVLVTVLDIVLKNNPDLQHRLLNSALSQYPLIGQQLGHIDPIQPDRAAARDRPGRHVRRRPGRGQRDAERAELGVGDPVRAPPGIPVVVAAQHGADHRDRARPDRDHGPVRGGRRGGPRAFRVRRHRGRPGGVARANIGLFWLAFRLGTAREIRWRQLRLAAVIAGVIWQILQAVGGYFISHQLAHASPVYGTFAVVIGLIAWLYLQAQLTLYAVQVSVVRAYRLWPRSIAPPPYTEQDRRAYHLYAQVEKRVKDEEIVVGVGGEDDREKTSG